MVILMPTFSIEELKRIIRKMEFNKTEPELLTELVYKAMKAGEGEKERLRSINKKSYELFKVLKDRSILHCIKGDEKEVEKLKKSSVGAIDGSFQVVGGVGGRWFVLFGVAQVIAEKGFTLQPTVIVEGGIEQLDSVDESGINRLAEIIMMLGEIKALRRITDKLGGKNESYVLIDGPIIDPPVYCNDEYVEERVNALRLCYERNINVVGFVKRIMGRNFLNYLSKKVESEDFINFTNDLDLLSSAMFNAVKSEGYPIYTHPIDYEEGCKAGDGVTLTYNTYKDKGLNVYYSYYKPLLRGRIFRVEYASFKPLEDQELLEKFSKIMSLINCVWTLPGMDEPLPIMIAHNKCNVRRGAAETIYYEIMAKALSEGNIHLWLESLSF
jgi:hypothetical protein